LRTTAYISHIVGGLKTIELENDWFRITILPEVGAKIYDLVWKPTSRNYLWHNPRIAPQPYPIGENFDNYWCGGWDDAFPTCDECDVNGDHFPNLGELRSLQWETGFIGQDGGSAVAELTSLGPITPVLAKKTVTLRRELPVVQVHYELSNIGPMPFEFVWGTHPAIDPGDSAVLWIPAKTGIVDQSSGQRFGVAGQHYPWPHVDVQGQTTDMSQTLGIEEGIFCRHFATDLRQGCFAVEDAAAGSGFLLAFPQDVCTCLMLWLVYGGWRGYRHVIVEPWTGLHVDLAEAIRNQTSRSLVPGQKFEVDIFATVYDKPQTWVEAANMIAQYREILAQRKDPVRQ
jgi:hypothetical protein